MNILALYLMERLQQFHCVVFTYILKKTLRFLTRIFLIEVINICTVPVSRNSVFQLKTSRVSTCSDNRKYKKLHLGKFA